MSGMVTLRSLVLFAVLGTVAFVVERRIYEAVIVPRLPGFSKVPLWWWLGEFTPPILVFLYAGWRGSSIRAAAAFAAAACLPWLMGRAMYGALTARPIGHDLWVGDSVFWIGAAVQSAFWFVIAGAGVGIRYCAKRRT
jgi:hypothetical protein